MNRVRKLGFTLSREYAISHRKLIHLDAVVAAMTGIWGFYDFHPDHVLQFGGRLDLINRLADEGRDFLSVEGWDVPAVVADGIFDGTQMLAAGQFAGTQVLMNESPLAVANTATTIAGAFYPLSGNGGANNIAMIGALANARIQLSRSTNDLTLTVGVVGADAVSILLENELVQDAWNFYALSYDDATGEVGISLNGGTKRTATHTQINGSVSWGSVFAIGNKTDSSDDDGLDGYLGPHVVFLGDGDAGNLLAESRRKDFNNLCLFLARATGASPEV